MGLKARMRAERLPEKLKEIRIKLGFSQNEILKQLKFENIYERTTISHYEKGEREPPLPVLLRYARLANIYVEVLIEDEIDLPNQIPAPKKLPL